MRQTADKIHRRLLRQGLRAVISSDARWRSSCEHLLAVQRPMLIRVQVNGVLIEFPTDRNRQGRQAGKLNNDADQHFRV